MLSSAIEMTAKKSHYGLDGTGRDSYIHFNNGGNYRGYVPQSSTKFERGVFPRSTKASSTYVGSRVPIVGRPLHYVGDGTGRDCYIVSNDGGLSQRHSTHNFLHSLRQPISRHEVPLQDVFTRTQIGWKGKMPSAYAGYQKNTSRRLASHRVYEDPYRVERHSFKMSIAKHNT